MGIILPDRHDVFFSYARDDNVLADDVVNAFLIYTKRRLEAELRRRINRPALAEADIFMDQHGLPANGDLSDELRISVRSSLFLMIFIGRWYPESEWCGKELECFMELFAGNRPEALKRTFVVVLQKSALPLNWGVHLEQPERPIYEGFYDDFTGGTIPAILEGPDGLAIQSPRFSRRLGRVVATMAERAVLMLNRVGEEH